MDGQPCRNDPHGRMVGNPPRWMGAATVRCRCGRSQLRESAACSRDSVQLSARKCDRAGIGSVPVLHLIHDTASRTNASDHAALLAQTRVSSRTVSRHARRFVRLRRYPSVCLPDRHIGTVFRPKSGCGHPKIDDPFHPFGNRHGSNVATFADQINYGPMFLALL